MKNQRSFQKSGKKPFSGKSPFKGKTEGERKFPKKAKSAVFTRSFETKPEEPQSEKSKRELSLRAPKGFRVAMGVHAVKEVLKVHPKHTHKIYLRPGWESSQEFKDIAAEARALKISIETKSERELDTLGSAHQGLAALIEGNPSWDWKAPMEDVTSCVLV
ncbi:MAG: RNA methyltransferase substrate-binding domain-containing protein, partial [Pseudobdellovibrionaceae bacterium]